MFQKLRNAWRDGRARTAYLVLLMVFFVGAVRPRAGLVCRTNGNGPRGGLGTP